VCDINNCTLLLHLLPCLKELIKVQLRKNRKATCARNGVLKSSGLETSRSVYEHPCYFVPQLCRLFTSFFAAHCRYPFSPRQSTTQMAKSKRHQPPQQPPSRRRTHSDPLTAALQPPPDETPDQRQQRLYDEAEAKRVSDGIDEMIQSERNEKRKAWKNEVKVLLLGQSESGKSTTLKRTSCPCDLNVIGRYWSDRGMVV
jgi:hypothetical protein